MGTLIKREAICDRCGKTSEDPQDWNNVAVSEFRLDGGRAGATLIDEDWCDECSATVFFRRELGPDHDHDGWEPGKTLFRCLNLECACQVRNDYARRPRGCGDRPPKDLHGQFGYEQGCCCAVCRKWIGEQIPADMFSGNIEGGGA